jgi:hypothetical protein
MSMQHIIITMNIYTDYYNLNPLQILTNLMVQCLRSMYVYRKMFYMAVSLQLSHILGFFLLQERPRQTGGTHAEVFFLICAQICGASFGWSQMIYLVCIHQNGSNEIRQLCVYIRSCTRVCEYHTYLYRTFQFFISKWLAYLIHQCLYYFLSAGWIATL